jgi:hypothetical protein
MLRFVRVFERLGELTRDRQSIAGGERPRSIRLASVGPSTTP